MTFEITETIGTILLTASNSYRYDCFIDDVLVAGAECFDKPQEPYEIYKQFIKKLIRGWNNKYKKILNNKNTARRSDIDFMNPRTIIREDIQDINLSLKRANEFIRLQKMEGDFQ